MAVNISKVLSEDWNYVRADIQAVAEVVHAASQKVKVIFENCYLKEKHKLKLCEICGELGADWVKSRLDMAPEGPLVRILCSCERLPLLTYRSRQQAAYEHWTDRSMCVFWALHALELPAQQPSSTSAEDGLTCHRLSVHSRSWLCPEVQVRICSMRGSRDLTPFSNQEWSDSRAFYPPHMTHASRIREGNIHGY